MQLVQIHFARGLLVLGQQAPHVGQAFGDGLEHRVPRFQRGLLRHVGHRHAALALQLAVIGLLQAGQYLQQRRFAGPVAAYQSHPFLRLQGEVAVVQQGDMSKGQTGLLQSKKRHAASLACSASPPHGLGPAAGLARQSSCMRPLYI